MSGQNLVKIIRPTSIGSLAWNDNDVNNLWSNSNLINLLNEEYFYSQNGTDGGNCYAYSSISGNCNYTGIGINNTFRTMIEEVTWYISGYYDDDATAEDIYGYERGGRYSIIKHIGLMYISDYGYSVLESSCARTTSLGSYNNPICASQSWLYGQGYEWTLTMTSSAAPVGLAYIYLDSGKLSYTTTNVGNNVRPTLYLNSNVYIIDGNGSISDPYIIGM